MSLHVHCTAFYSPATEALINNNNNSKYDFSNFEYSTYQSLPHLKVNSRCSTVVTICFWCECYEQSPKRLVAVANNIMSLSSRDIVTMAPRIHVTSLCDSPAGTNGTTLSSASGNITMHNIGWPVPSDFRQNC